MTTARMWVVYRLARANMTVISGVTYLAGAVLGARGFVDMRAYFAGWLFVILTQFMTHFLGEVADFTSDNLNRYSSPITGGSKVIPSNLASKKLANLLGYTTFTLSTLTLLLLVPSRAQPVGLAILAMAWAYSAEPVKLNHRCLGEIDAAIVTNYLLPYFAAAVQGDVSGAFPWWDSRLAILVVPPMIVKISLFLLLNLADRRPDWAAGKITLAVVLGDRASAHLHAFLMLSAYIVAATIAFVQRSPLMLFLMLPSLPYGYRISNELIRGVPYRLHKLLGPALLHSTLLVWGVLLHTLLTSRAAGPRFYHIITVAFAYISVDNVMRGRRREAATKAASEAAEQAALAKDDAFTAVSVNPGCQRRRTNLHTPLGDIADIASDIGSDSLSDSNAEESGNASLRRNGVQPSKTSSTFDVPASQADAPPGTGAASFARKMSEIAAPPPTAEVVVTGAGVAGLVAAACLARSGLDVVILEKRPDADRAETGADLALWPGAIGILKELGVSAKFFEERCFPLRTVHMCNMDFPSSPGEGVHATVLKTIDMEAVTDGTGENFVLVSRQDLMTALRSIVCGDIVVYGATVTSVSESEEDEAVNVSYALEGGNRGTITARIALGCDGARSVMRKHVAQSLGPDSVRFCGEVVYRGVLNLADNPELASRVEPLLPDSPEAATMRINYGAGLRSSFGYMAVDGSTAYWWVKQSAPEMPACRTKQSVCTWPEPLRSLHEMTPDASFYMHPVEDSAALARWSSNRVALVGDAAHVVTPNMGQGACLAVEDAFVLTSLLSKFWHEPDGHVEAFYRFEMCRKPFAESVAAESRKQLFLGQLQARPLVWLREKLLAVIPGSVLEGKLRANNFDAREFRDMFRNAVGQH